MQQIAVTYCGHRPFYKDGAYGSGIEFEKGQTKLVPEDLAKKLLRHGDVYIRGEDDNAPTAIIDPPSQFNDDEGAVMDVRDSINTMDLDTLKEYAMNNYRIKMHPNIKLETARSKVVMLVDLYGVT